MVTRMSNDTAQTPESKTTGLVLPGQDRPGQLYVIPIFGRRFYHPKSCRYKFSPILAEDY